MRKYFWSIEENRTISIDEIEKIRLQFYPEKTLSDFLSDCSYLNNGDLQPLEIEIERERKQVAILHDEEKEIRSAVYDKNGNIVSGMDGYAEYLSDVVEDIETLQDSIKTLSALARESI